jgi:NADP-dependent 3-hydroxy acid dehydrogenase YdfG
MSELPGQGRSDDDRMNLMKLDVCSTESVEELRKKVVEEFGHVDIL